MPTKVYLDANPHEVRVAVVEEERLAELYVERKGGQRTAGNIYKGIVKNVLPGMQAAFVDIGLERNAFLYAGDINQEDEELRLDDSVDPATVPDIRSLVKVGQEVMVQVLKEPFGGKGARITTNITLPGRVLVLMPFADYLGISRRIEGEAERARLKAILEKSDRQGMGIIARTVARGAGEEELQAQFAELQALYQSILKNYQAVQGPALVHSDENLVFRAVRDILSEETECMEVSDPAVYAYACKVAEMMSPHLMERIHLFTKHYDMFRYFGLDTKIDKALRRKVWLKSGGYLIFDAAEALTVIDVNTGKYVGREDLQQTILNTNLEAAREIAVQIRLRDISGIIVVDFIDLEAAEDREKVLQTLREATKRDRTRTTILGLTDLGIVEMTRKKVKQSLSSVYYEPCPYCNGEGRTLSAESVALDARREVLHMFNETQYRYALIKAHPHVIEQMRKMSTKKTPLIPRMPGKRVYVLEDPAMHLARMECEGLEDADPATALGAQLLEG